MSGKTWMRRAGDGLPHPPRKSTTVYLFTCCKCGLRWANPPVPLRHCGCGGSVVAHEFSLTEYSHLRRYGIVPHPNATRSMEGDLDA